VQGGAQAGESVKFSAGVLVATRGFSHNGYMVRRDVATGATRQVGIRQLKDEATRLVREVRDGAEFVITVNGTPVAKLSKFTDDDAELARRAEIDRWFEELGEIGKQIASHWPAGLSAADAVAEQRR